MATSKVVLNEKDVSLLLRDFLEENGQYECLVAFERSTGLYPPSLSAELVSLREIILWGNLDELQKRIFEPLQNMGEESELRKCKYVIAKQRYLETLLEVNSDKADLLKQQLAEVEDLCPSPEEFRVLFSLLTLPSLSTSPDYKHWTIQKGRLQCFHQLASWISKVLGMRAHLIPPQTSSHPPEQRLPKTRLVQLLAKGLLYEQCEAICAHPTTTAITGEATERGNDDGSIKLLDLYNWIKHQPDSAFQLPPSTLQLQVRSKSGTSSAESREESFRGSSESELSRSPRAAMGESSRPLLMEESQSTDQQNFMSGDSQTPSVAAAREKATNKDMAHRQMGEAELIPPQSKSAESVAQNDRESQLAKEAKNLHPESNMSENLTSKEAVSAGPQVGVQLAKLTPNNMMQFDDNFADKNGGRVDDSSPDGGKQAEGIHSREDASRPSLVEKLKSEAEIAEQIMKEVALPTSTSAPLLPAILLKQTMKFEDNFTDDSGAVEPTPPPPRHVKKKSGRKSSTPKPSSSRGLTQQISPPSPSTSPVPRIPSAQAPGSSRSSVREEHSATPTCKAKKHIDFSAENLEESIVFPTAKLLAHVKDKQVVRSVAFSKSGSVVAIGANSRTLRLCYTEPLLQENTDAEVDQELPVFYSEQHYHKGSIYCMSWWGDTLLASGSNDQSIRLLSYDPTSQIPETACVSLGQMKIHRGTIRDLVFTLDGLLVSGGVGDNIIKITNPSTGQVVNTLYGHFDQILGLYVVKENVIASASQDKSVKLWDLRVGQAHATIKLPQSVTSIATNTYSNQIASALLDGACAVHDLNTLKPISTYNAHSDECRTVRYSSSSEPSPWLMTGSYDGTICMADTKTFEWQQIAQHRDKVVQCRWHGTQSSLFASTGADNRACFWRLAV